MKIIKILSLICFLTISILAQREIQRVSGKISDSDGKAIENAEVTLISTDSTFKRVTRTNNNGFYEITVNRIGSFYLSASYVKDGVKKTSPNITVYVSIDKDTTADLQISDTSIREEVTISADSRQTIEQVSKTVDIIDAQEMRDRADFSLVESLQTIPGFRVQQLGGFGRTATIKTRGLRNQDTAILIDGIRFRDPSAITGDASPFLSDITLTSVSRVEVMRGSGSSLYGTNAIGGTVDLQTPKPQAGLHGQVSYAAGALGLQRFRSLISDGTEDGKFGFNLAAARTVYTKGIDGEDDAHNTNFQSRIEYDPFTGTSISGRFFISDAYVRLNNNPDTFGALPISNSFIIDAQPGVNFVPDLNDSIANQKSKFFNGQLAFSHVLNSKASLRGYYSGLKTSRKNDNSGVSTSFFDGLIQTANATLNWTPDSIHDIKMGYEFEHEKFGNDGLTPGGTGNFFTRAFQSSSTLFAQD